MIRISLFANYKFALDAPQSTAVVVVVGGSDFCQGFFFRILYMLFVA